MAILEMNKIFICGLHSDRKAVLEELHKREIMEISEPISGELEYKRTEKSIAQFDEFIRSCEAALSITDEYSDEKSGLFSSRRQVPIKAYSMKTAESDVTLKAVYKIIKLSDKIREHAENIQKLTLNQLALKPYSLLDIPMNMKKTGGVILKAGMLNGMWTEEQLESLFIENELSCIHYEILSASKENTSIWLAFLKGEEQRLYLFLQKIGFSEASWGFSNNSPAKEIEALEEEKNKLLMEISEYNAQIKEYSRIRHEIELLCDHLSLRKEKYQALSKIGMTEHSFILEGYIPKNDGECIKKLLMDEYSVYVELTIPEEAEETPVAFRNNAFAAPVEGITETYSMPSPVDIDPNMIMAFFYYLFFGMMFSDAGYGVLLVIVCGYLGFSGKLEKAKRKNYKMFFYCGLSTTFWGIMYGSFFGDIISTASGTFFGKEISFSPIWIDPVAEPLTLLIFSVSFGLIHILVGMSIKFYMLCRQKKVAEAIFDVGFWILVLIGIGILSIGAGVSMPILIETGKYIAIFGTIGRVLTGGRENKNIFGRLFVGIVGLYDITGYVSDALSYSRLMALGLATGVIASVINVLGSISGDSFVGMIMFIIISILGHGINFAINMLGAYVHTNRLQYVEFFSKFYEGGRRKFAPFQMNTKYHEFSEM